MIVVVFFVWWIYMIASGFQRMGRVKQAKKHATMNGHLTYLDSKLTERFVSNDEVVEVYCDNHGYKWLIEKRTQKRIRNITQAGFDKEEERWKIKAREFPSIYDKEFYPVFLYSNYKTRAEIFKTYYRRELSTIEKKPMFNEILKYRDGRPGTFAYINYYFGNKCTLFDYNESVKRINSFRILLNLDTLRPVSAKWIKCVAGCCNINIYLSSKQIEMISDYVYEVTKYAIENRLVEYGNYDSNQKIYVRHPYEVIKKHNDKVESETCRN